MNEPNAEEQQPNNRLSNRATNFLLMGSNSSTEQSHGEPQMAEEPHAYDDSQAIPPQDPSASVVSSETPNLPKQHGVISSKIMPADRPGNRLPDERAANTSELKTQRIGKAQPKTSRNLSPEEKEKIKNEKIENLAEKITNVLEKFNHFKTGFLDPNKDSSEKLKFMAHSFPGLSKILLKFATQLGPLITFLQKFNEKLAAKGLIQKKRPSQANKDMASEAHHAPAEPADVSFLELAEKNIIFCDNRKRPLYTQEQMRGKHGYTASEAVLAPMIYENIIQAFHEVAPKAKAIPTPQSGIYAGIPMDQVMKNISEIELKRFLNYVQRFPRGYVGKNFRITESFAGWVVSGTPDD